MMVTNLYEAREYINRLTVINQGLGVLILVVVILGWIFHDPFTIKDAQMARDRSVQFTQACEHDGGTVLELRPAPDTMAFQCVGGSMRARK